MRDDAKVWACASETLICCYLRGRKTVGRAGVVRGQIWTC